MKATTPATAVAGNVCNISVCDVGLHRDTHKLSRCVLYNNEKENVELFIPLYKLLVMKLRLH